MRKVHLGSVIDGATTCRTRKDWNPGSVKTTFTLAEVTCLRCLRSHMAYFQNLSENGYAQYLRYGEQAEMARKHITRLRKGRS